MIKTNTDIVMFTGNIIESIKLYAEQKNIRLSFSSALRRKVITIDEDKYERILLNLLSNAIKFTPEGKSIMVDISRKTVGGIKKICIRVRDEGPGIPDDKRDLVFQRFGQVDSSLTRRAEGTGLGLHLVRLLVETMNGEITLESEAGAGSAFTVFLPEITSEVTAVEKERTKSLDDSLQKAAAIQFSDFYF
jgi:signal transduction histidine kinase